LNSYFAHFLIRYECRLIVSILDRFISVKYPSEQDFSMLEDQSHLAVSFPIESQTSLADKMFILASMAFVTKINKTYSYVEIGSYMGGSLTPFLMDSHCQRVLSIDDRGRQQPDERGVKYDYTGITHQTMIDNLQSHGISTDKLKTYDGSVDVMPPLGEQFDLAFIDGEHTDVACVRDFLWLLPMMMSNSLIMFHDSYLIYKALRIIQLFLAKSGLPFRFIKNPGSEMSGIFLGAFSTADLTATLGATENPEDFYSSAEAKLISHLIVNRVEMQFNYKIKPPSTKTA
jgi:hypothetical protein